MKRDLHALLAAARVRGWRVERPRGSQGKLRHPSGAVVLPAARRPTRFDPHPPARRTEGKQMSDPPRKPDPASGMAAAPAASSFWPPNPARGA